MKRIISAALAVAMVCTAATAQVTGTYAGSIVAGSDFKLPLAVNIDDGSATLDSPDQGRYGIPMQILWQQGDSVSLAIPQIGLTYRGRLHGNELRGQFEQGTLSVPLTLVSANPLQGASASDEKSQTPQPPFPYKSEEVVVNPNAQTHLAGTLVIPDGFKRGVTPVVLFISGSGQQDRDETLDGGHKPFLVLADALARKGVASLRYDDRNIGGSSGPLATATTEDFTDDAAAWLPLLRTQGFGKIGILGHSEGARIAAALAPKADFLVMMGLPAERGDSIMIDQSRIALEHTGIDRAAIDRYCSALQKFYGEINTTGKLPADPVGYAMALTDEWPATEVDNALAGNLMQVARTLDINMWLLHFIQDSPAADIAAIRVPALAIYGENDQQIPVPENPERVASLNPSVTLMVLPGLNHLMQPSTTGSPDEYATIPTTIDQSAIDAITGFIEKVK